jgi:pyridoxamine 5'-phosphate oxidase
MKHSDIYNLRKEYSLHALDESKVNPNPLIQFQTWLEEALIAKIDEPYAFNLATISASGQPDSRIVLLRSATAAGFSFFSNYTSQKGLEIKVHPFGSLNFFWAGLERQVRIQGKIEPLSEVASDEYFQSRPRESQIGAWASEQSQIIPNREYLEGRVIFFTKKFEGQAVPRPSHWGGYLIIPHRYEFWQGRESRLHDRILYQKVNESQKWQIGRLSP